MESVPSAAQLEKNRNGAVGLGRRSGQEAVGPLRRTITHQSPTVGRPSMLRSTQSGSRPGTEDWLMSFVGGGSRSARCKCQRVAEDQLARSPPGEPTSRCGVRALVDLDSGWAATGRRDTGEDAGARAHFQHDVVPARRPMTRPMFSSTRKRGRVPVRDALGSWEKAAVAFASGAKPFASSRCPPAPPPREPRWRARLACPGEAEARG